MKIHAGECTGKVCTRTHAYKCRRRECHQWFPQQPFLVSETFATYSASPTYPYCSVFCARRASEHDKGYWLFSNRVDPGMESDDAVIQREEHFEFHNAITQTQDK